MIRTIVFIIFWFASLVGCAQTTDLLYSYKKQIKMRCVKQCNGFLAKKQVF